MRSPRSTLVSIASRLIGFPHRVEQDCDRLSLIVDGPADYAQGHEIANALSTPDRPVRCSIVSHGHGEGLDGVTFDFHACANVDDMAHYLSHAAQQIRYVVYPATRTYEQRRFDDSPTGPDHCFGGGYAVLRFATAERGAVVGWGITPTSAYAQARLDAGRGASITIVSLPADIGHVVRELAA